jgi:predicted metal-dependent phosphoesterase TrpH
MARRLCQVAFIVAAFAATPAVASDEPASDIVLHGALAGADHQTWHLVPFEVPPGTTRITVDFDYTTRDAHTTVDLGLLSPGGFRGWSGGNKRTFTLSATDATPAYLPGPLDAGQWNLLLGVPNIRQAIQAEYTAHIQLEHASEPASTTATPVGPVLRKEPGWYRGDLHMHTAHSDGSCLSQRQQRVPCPVFLTARTASERGLDFIAITDHNTLSQADAIRELQPYFDTLLLMPGREITTFEGHANLFGTLAPLDFTVRSREVPDWNVLLTQIEAIGGVLSINHPIRPSGEECMGCGWTARGKVDYSRFQAVEVVNGLDADTAFSGISFWEQLLSQGYRLTAIGGSDNHDALRPAVDAAALREPDDAASPSPATLAKLKANSGVIGTPTTVIYADELSQAGIVAAIRRGRVCIDVAGTRDRLLDISAAAGSHSTRMGGTLEVRRGTTVHLRGTVQGVMGGRVEPMVDGRHLDLLKKPEITAPTGSFEFSWRSDGKRHWVRVDVRDATGHLVLVGNPVYLSGLP